MVVILLKRFGDESKTTREAVFKSYKGVTDVLVLIVRNRTLSVGRCWLCSDRIQ